MNDRKLDQYEISFEPVPKDDDDRVHQVVADHFDCFLSCRDCDGTGERYDRECGYCGGKGGNVPNFARNGFACWLLLGSLPTDEWSVEFNGEDVELKRRGRGASASFHRFDPGNKRDALIEAAAFLAVRAVDREGLD